MYISFNSILIKLGCQEYTHLYIPRDLPCASEEHADLPVRLRVGDIKQKLKVVVVTRGQLGKKSQLKLNQLGDITKDN